MSASDSRPFTQFLLPDLFRATALRCPDQIALDIPPGRGRPERQTLTYAALDALSDALAGHLAARIGSGEAIVALLIPRTSPLLFAAQLGVLKAGGAYTCLDPGFPDERMREIIEDAAPIAVLADAVGMARLAGLTLPDGLVLDVAGLVAQAHESAPAPAKLALAHDRLAYVIYTSGTTGKPKGVMIEHGQIANLIRSDIAEFALTEADRVVQGSSSAYDSSIEETWLAFASGARLLVMDDATARLGPDLIGWLRDEGATVLCPPPTLLRATGCTDPAKALPALRLLYVGGEALPRDIADLWGAGRRLVNGYGPTECAVTCVRGDIVPDRPITIGKAVPGMAAFVLDAALEQVPDGVQGELCMAGAGLARGYRNAPELTAEKFVVHPQLGLIYRTGDLAEYDADGNLIYHGRIDAQVKLRGYRIELGEIEARLAAIDGVRAAACTLQGEGATAELVAFIVPETATSAPAGDDLRSVLATTLPAYMVPGRIGLLDALPTSVSGKLNRKALPLLGPGGTALQRDMVAPASAMEALLSAGYADILRRDVVSVTDDFFVDLGGDSLSAAMLVTLLRDDPRTAWITVSDIYEARSPRALALLAPDGTAAATDPTRELVREGQARPWLANLVQLSWLAGEVIVAGWAAWFAAFRIVPLLYGGMGLVPFLMLAPLLALVATAAYVPFSIVVAVAVKRLVIGHYRAIRTPVWSAYYLRHWVVQQTARLVPWPLLQGTQLQQVALRALGARIGRGVHIHRDVELARGGWDLLDIGDNVSLGQGAQISLTELDRGDLVIGPITLEAGATLQVRAGVSGHCSIGAGAELTALSVLNPGQNIPAGELWDGVPARRIGLSQPAPALDQPGRRLSPLAWDALVFLSEAVLGAIVALPAQLAGLAAFALAGVGYEAVWRWFYHPDLTSRTALLMIGWTVLGLPLTLAWTAVVMRLMGRVEAGVIDRWSIAFLRVWLKSGLLSVSGEWLTGTMFWRGWLRLAGMKLGRDCEISTILDVVPELVEIGEGTFFADGIYLGGAWVRQGHATLGHVTLGRNTFLGNHAVIPPGVTLPSDILIGIATVADPMLISQGQSRFGHPSFDLPRREVVEVDRSLTHDPGPLRYWNRVFWEALRFALPVLPLLLSAQWYAWLVSAAQNTSPAEYDLVVIPSATLFPLVVLCGAVLALKWLLIGRVKPGQHALWSCWCSRWDFVYVAWARYATTILRRLDGTFLLPQFLRAMGLKIGKRAVLGPLFAQVVDPDMIEVGDGATVSAMFQAHTFEDRVLKVDKVRIRAGATVAHGVVPLYGAVIGERAHVGAHSVVMKQEHLLPGVAYQGVPTRVTGREYLGPAT
ncbi:non-ribosomal peptide synthetase [Novosphingobium sp. FKTRR1]|uniref:non-ribosomal peptide synthetase n=1 Tax=Novosphingobium sp. FKTRR1 TaxID=2879118 RepID=UPI001CF084B7|nr:non-ribosomal peptide synthetase [Novosphingobium sp. FKTRR1]